jgi:hypothetical protein
MSVREIIQHSLEKNPLAMKEALDGEMKARVAVAIEEKMIAAMSEAAHEDDDEDEDEDEDDDDEDDDEDEDMKESFDLSDYTVEELEDFMVSEDFDQLDEISKKTLTSYVKKASYDAASNAAKFGAGETDKKGGSAFVKAHKRLGGIAKATDRLAK